ncbi:hypothetical protein A2574_03190 [Candidatus Shapirobacteria bacterium RIFOXYD1_FULL_38_32]|uniref:Uncharacterized protein n=3 Tax=Candidatus Shapironibacteriota TaxID=1752721 RepID=A0A0G0JRJ2_9BACT|nr:MAG: hypothetical protein US90_C0008G0045 [Candidatus Shapirobacteria bacterium GW2011_GWE2_38_30]KKQ89364.1 MAG: hypothetical protein UT14_C0060G0008 [Candidatus Shapirobacteria bacterium GW2011_GWE1_38_92]OGL55922.1 MAG: hypothetical protein A2367_01995 [Candidatus Shapirobacteria bacterium RIFOXYB1_FULL_38_38]OGL56562.1 MAG: hypothetical protein A2195_00640 [Candidatus Shapirobacteria bacterium RIFOXYA1_FULL_39_17]OGL56682.1 MAG: hypothetical protein A2410_01410 [Candidatus Shapirobacteri
MTTEVFITNHPDSGIILEPGQRISFKQRASLAKYFIKHVDPRQKSNIYHLAQGIGDIHDCKTVTTISANQVIYRGQIIPGRNENNRPRQIKNGESLIVIKNEQPYITVRRLARK